MYQDHTALQAAGQLLLALAFLATIAAGLYPAWRIGRIVRRSAAEPPITIA